MNIVKNNYMGGGGGGGKQSFFPLNFFAPLF